jgi:hypothetical protein
MESINNFNGGMQSDLSKQYLKPNTYLQALNFRPVNEMSTSNGSLVNIKGNECKITFPDLQNVYKIIVEKGTNNTTNNYTITINGTSKTTSINNNTLGIDLYNLIISSFPNCYKYTGTTIATKTFDIAYDDNYIVIYQQPVYQDCTTVTSVDSTIVLTPTTSDGTQATLYFVNQGISNSLVQDTNKPYVYGTIGRNIISIGSTFILNDIYILTAPTLPSAPVNDELQSLGTIWKLTIDDITKQHTLTLIYSNNLDFSAFHPIPPSAITGRYESKEIQRIYWSDNYNKIRVLNCIQPQLMALNPTNLSIMPKVEYTQAILNSIGTASPGLPAGCFQAGYRLSKVLGSVTNYSELSNPVYLTTSAESSLFEVYEGNIGASGKSITWKLTGLDTNYDRIEFIVTYKDSENAIPTITSLGTIPLIEDMTFTYSNTGATSNTEVTLEEFLLFNGTFTHAKTCDTKDNRLFWGNVRAPRKELENYDTRAFRANDAGEIRTTNSGTNANRGTTVSIVASANSETEDMINEYYDSSGDYSTNACYLKPSTSTTTKILGGEGVNISYEFGTQIFQLDNKAVISGSEGWDLFNDVVGSPYRGSATESSPIQLVYNYPQNNKFAALKQPERTSLLKGFQHEEIYRFGIQFFDKQGNPYFTKWIGDIKMPSYGDVNSNPGGTVNDFRLTYQGAFNDIIAQILYIKFTVSNLNLIEDIVGSYQIVRVERDGNNKTIWGVGMINPMISKNGNDLGADAVLPAGFASDEASFTQGALPPVNRRYYKPYPSQETVETLNFDYDDGLFNANFGRFKTFDCFDFDVNLRPSYNSGDRLLIRDRLISINYRDTGYRQWFEKDYGTTAGQKIPGNTQNIDNGTTPPFVSGVGTNNDSSIQPFFIMKMVNDPTLGGYSNYADFISPNTNQEDYIIADAKYVDGNDSTTFGAYNIHNNGQDNPVGVLSPTDNPSAGKRTLILDVRNNKDSSENGLYTSITRYGCVAPSSGDFYKLLALYYKPNSSLYGGSTYAARSNNIYIPCSEYIQTVKKNINVNTSLTFKVFGGDTFTTSYDMQKTFKGEGAKYFRFDYSSLGVVLNTLSAKAKFSTSFFFPTTGFRNQELRLGNHINKSLNSTAGYTEDEYLIETYTNAENNIKTYFPKPLDFQTSDEWINRIYWSELKFNNEPLDSWAVYLTDTFYDVEGNYGGINALISLKENMYYLQDRGVGMLLINPVSMINDSAGTPIKLGNGTDAHVIQKHYYKAIDTGTVHQWSVYRSQSAITFVDARHKKIYLFNGESVTPVSDIKGQRNFVIKRLHNELLKNDNPIINKGILTTYDYYHNEFLYTFNDVLTEDTTNNENLTLAYSEILDAFTGMYSFTPNLYINSNKYLISTNSSNKLWFHNYGNYGLFYNTQYPSTLKLIVNDNPLHTKIFDNSTWNSESIKDNIEWNDDLNIYPGSPTNPSYPDDVNHQSDTFTKIRCYNDWQNTDWLTLSTISPNNTLTRKERNFNVQIPRNKFDYDSTAPSLVSLFNPANLTKTLFGERIRDKYMIVDLYYPNTIGNRFIVHNFKTTYRISDR